MTTEEGKENEELYLSRDKNDAFFDECTHILVSRHELNATRRTVSRAMDELRSGLVIPVYELLGIIYEDLDLMASDTPRVIAVVEVEEQND